MHNVILRLAPDFYGDITARRTCVWWGRRRVVIRGWRRRVVVVGGGGVRRRPLTLHQELRVRPACTKVLLLWCTRHGVVSVLAATAAGVICIGRGPERAARRVVARK